MNYYINGDKVSQNTYDRDLNDNFNLGIEFTVTVNGDVTSMTYEEQ